MPGVGQWVRCTDGAWMVRRPQLCPRGHRLGAGQALVGHQAVLMPRRAHVLDVSSLERSCIWCNHWAALDVTVATARGMQRWVDDYNSWARDVGHSRLALRCWV
jgi:hypothetical protein